MSDQQEGIQSQIESLTNLIQDYEVKLQIAERRATEAEFKLVNERGARRRTQDEMIEVIHRLEKRVREIDPSYKHGSLK